MLKVRPVFLPGGKRPLLREGSSVRTAGFKLDGHGGIVPAHSTSSQSQHFTVDPNHSLESTKKPETPGK